MKKLILSLVVLGGFIFLGTSVAEAQTAKKKQETTTQTTRPGFIDNNGDGVCDNYDGTRPGKGLGPGNGQRAGRADGKGLGKGKGLRDGSGQGQRLRDGSSAGRVNSNGRQLRDGTGPNCTVPAN